MTNKKTNEHKHSTMYVCTADPINKLGDTLLGLAVKQGKLEIVKHLVTEYSAKPNGKYVG